MGKRKRRRSDLDDESKENRIVKKMKKLLKQFSRQEDKKCSSESRARIEGHGRSKSFEGKDLRNASQRPSRSPSYSPQSSPDRIQSPATMEGLTQELTEGVADGVPSEHDQEPPDNTGEMQELVIERQGVEKLNIVLPSAENQKLDAPGMDEETVIEDLDLEILEVIGKRVADDRVLAPAIPKSIAVRLEDIIKKGLPKEEKEKLIKEHAPPKNCVLIDPPKLNEEIKVSVAEASKKRDDRIVEKQKKILACLALLGSAVVDIINNGKADNTKQKISQMALIRKLSEAARLLADLQRDETLTRRSLILAAISSSQKEILDSITADEWLFGQKLAKKLQDPASTTRLQIQNVGRVSEQELQPESRLQESLEEPERRRTQQFAISSVSRAAEENVVMNEETTPSVEIAYPGGRKVIGEAFIRRGIPKESITITMSSLSESSLKQYDCALKKWWKFCKTRGASPYDAELTNILKFLTEEFEKGASYGSLNSMRSAISLTIGPEVGQSEVIKRFFKGLSNLRPPKPKYEVTWDPKIVLDYFENLQNKDLSLELLSRKLVTLLALVTGQRIQTLSLINIKNIIIKEELIEIKIPEKIKTSKLGRNQPILFLPFYKKNLNICPANTLLCYIKRTKDLRKDSVLFISFKKPFKRASTQTLSCWVKNTLFESGIDTDIFSAHSTRHASTSAAKRKGVNIDLIRKSAGWTDKSDTFTRFYDRPIIQNGKVFGQTILDNQN